MTDAGDHALFAYGSLRIASVMEAVVGRALPGRAAVLPGFRRRRLRDRSYPGVVPDPAETTDGVLYTGLRDGDLDVLDTFEGEPYRRERRRVRVAPARGAAAADGAVADGFVYVVRPEHLDWMTDAPWRLEDFRRESLERFLAQCRTFRADWLRGATGRTPD